MKKSPARKVVEDYLGYEVDDVKTYRDPRNSNYIAIRAIKGPQTFDFLLDESEGYFRDFLEEAEFETWPPKSDKKNMMKLENVRMQ